MVPKYLWKDCVLKRQCLLVRSFHLPSSKDSQTLKFACPCISVVSENDLVDTEYPKFSLWLFQAGKAEGLEQKLKEQLPVSVGSVELNGLTQYDS